MGAALEAQGRPPRARSPDDLRHPRPDRGADLRRQGRRDERRPRGADRHAGRTVRAAGAYVRRLFHRLAGHELSARARSTGDRARVDGLEFSLGEPPIRPCRRDSRVQIGVRPEFVHADLGPRGFPCRCAGSPISAASGSPMSTSAGHPLVATVPRGDGERRRVRARRDSIPPTPTSMSPTAACREGGMIDKPINNRAWFFVLPVLALRPLLVDHSDDDGGELFGPGHARRKQLLLERRPLVPRPPEPDDDDRRALQRRACFARWLSRSFVWLIEIPLGIAHCALRAAARAGRSAFRSSLIALPMLIPWNVVGTIWQIFTRADIGLFGAALTGLGSALQRDAGRRFRPG